MKNTEVLSTIMAIPGATMVRTNKSNYIAVPTEEGYMKVNVTVALDKDTANHKAFDFEAAKADYEVWKAMSVAKEAERAARPPRMKGPNPEAQARRDALDANITALPHFEKWTATDIMNALPDYVGTVMAIGSSAKRLVEKGVLNVEEIEKKSYYTKA